MTISEDLQWRGLIKDHTFTDITWLDEPKTFYLGADAGSANSLTVGNLAIFMLAKRLCDAGWKTVLLMGGATSLIGDPGGKDSERPLVSKDTVDENIQGIKSQVEKLFSGSNFTLVNNYDWFKGLGYLDFLREIGKHYSVTELIQREYISERIGAGGAGISYAEFSYNMIQGYDYWHLYKNHGVVMQIGGSDQWGNMLSGVPLIRKKENAEVHAMSMPLIVNKTTGKKFGKSEDGAVWLDEEKTSVFRFYQFWLNSGDADVVDYLKIFTLLTKEDIERIENEHKENPQDRIAQKACAFEIAKIVHGQQRAESVARISGVLFDSKPYNELTKGDMEDLTRELYVSRSGEKNLVDLLVETNLASSKGEARRFLESNAVYINGEQIPLNKATLEESDYIHDYCVVRRGKNMLALVAKS